MVSIIVSAFNEAENMEELYARLRQTLSMVPSQKFEIIIVNDGSTDNTLFMAKEAQHKDPRVKIINFSRNFGHELAMTAGMDYAQGDAILFMDADLQHPPEVIPTLIEKWKKGHDIVLTRRTDNLGQSKWQKRKALLFYRILNLFSDVYIPAQTPDFRLIDRKYVDVIKRMKENNRMFRGLISWIGCPNQAIVEFEAPERHAGTSKYSFKKLLALAIDSVVSFSIKPLRISSYIGIVSALVSSLLGVVFVYDFLTSETYQFTGYGTTVVMVVFIGSVQLIVLGIIGEYLGRIHLEVKNRPLYIAEYLVNESHSENNETVNP